MATSVTDAASGARPCAAEWQDAVVRCVCRGPTSQSALTHPWVVAPAMPRADGVSCCSRYRTEHREGQASTRT